MQSVVRYRDILALVAREQVRTAYEVAAKLKLPISSAYNAVAELERLSCLSRDEAGYLLLGTRPQQMALDAMGFDVAVQRLAPLVRYLRDQTGETVFVACLSETVHVGTIAVGFNPGCLSVEPFQKYRVVEQMPPIALADVLRLRLLSDRDYASREQHINFLATPLAASSSSLRSGPLVVGAARCSDFQDPLQIARKVDEVRTFFARSQA